MAALFLDSSALVKQYIQESGTAWIVNLLSPVAGNVVYLARITAVEVASGIIRRARGGGIQADAATIAISNLRADFATSFLVEEITPALVLEAVQLTETYSLRAYDAVQLAAALQVNNNRAAAGLTSVRFVSADSNLNQAARAAGLSVDDPNAHP